MKRISLAEGVAENKVAAEAAQRNGMRPQARKVLILGVLFAIIFFLTMVLPTFIFQNSTMQYTPAVFMDIMAKNINSFIGVFTGNGSNYEMRFVATVIAAVSGCALGLCGSTYQGAFNNSLAAPKTLGVMSGGALGALVYLLFVKQHMPTMHWSGSATAADIADWYASLNPFEFMLTSYGRPFCTVLGCFLIVGLVLLISSFLGKGRLSNVTVIIAGQIFAVAITALIQFARYIFTVDGNQDLADELMAIENYTMTGTYYYRDLLVAVLPILICIVIVLALRNRLTLLSFGDDEARSMGVNVNRTRYIMIIVCTLMVGLSISFAGHVAYLGFISAHISRKIVGPDFKYLLPASVFVGGGFMCIIQILCDSGLPLTSPYAAGVTCSIVGALVFLVLALRQGRRGGSDWER